MSCRPRLTDFDNAGADLEQALLLIKGLADTVYSMEEAHGTSLAYLSDRLHEHRKAAMDAFRRIYRLDQYRETDDSEGGAA